MKIVVASPICPQAIERLSGDHDVVCSWDTPDGGLSRFPADADALVFRSGVMVDAKFLTRAHGLRLVVRAGSGTDNLDIECLQKRGIELVRIQRPGARAVAELTFGLMIMLARHIPKADAALRKGHWLKHQLAGYLLHGKTLGIVGAGQIGSMVGTMAVAWGMRVVGCVARPGMDAAVRLNALGISLAGLQDVVEEADFLTIHVPLDETTRGLIGSTELARMNPGAYLVNMARGGVVDERALRLALGREEGLAGAALDVHEREGEGCISPLAELPNVILTPHIGATTIDTQREIGMRVVVAINEFASRQAAATPVSTRRYNHGGQITSV